MMKRPVVTSLLAAIAASLFLPAPRARAETLLFIIRMCRVQDVTVFEPHSGETYTVKKLVCDPTE
ncbi:MAG TPA: hypothetical protein VMU06_06485 [Stellaceae bacterium]|nr:hypothetical protein [Stellaceae bacterium]